MKKIEAPYLLFALVFGFMALIAPYLMEEHRLTFEGRVAMLLFQAGMVFACSLSTAKHLHDKWVQEDINDRQARLRMPKPQDEENPSSADSTAAELVHAPSADPLESPTDAPSVVSHREDASSSAPGADAGGKPPSP